jgi:hypothetical protein
VELTRNFAPGSRTMFRSAGHHGRMKWLTSF